MKKLIISLGVLAMVYSYGQKVSWQKNLNSNTQDFLSGLAITIDGQYLVSGSSISNNHNPAQNNQNRGYDYYILKLDQQGQKVWDKNFSGNRHDNLNSTISTREGGFLLAGSSYSTLGFDKKEKSFGGSDIWLIKIDENGKEEWQKTIGTKYNEEARSVAQTSDEGYIVAGSTNHPKLGYGSKDVFITKLDKTGKIINQLILGGKNVDEVEKVIATKNGGALLGIYSRSSIYDGLSKAKINSTDLESQSLQSNHSETSTNNLSAIPKSNRQGEESYPINFYSKSLASYGEGDYWLVKLDKNGNVEWERSYGGSEDDRIKEISLTSSGYIIGGESRSQQSGNKKTKQEEGTDLWILALDEDGTEDWQKSYSFKNQDILMSINTIKEIGDNSKDVTKGFLIGGYTQSEGKVEKNDETFWMLYIDINGKEVWRKYVEGKDKNKEERLTSAILNRDGSYILAGTSAEEQGKESWKVVKLEDKQIEDLMENKDIQIYPNPVKDYCYVEIGLDFDQADIYVYDMAGKVVQQLQTKNRVTKINTSRLPQGIYIVKANIPAQKDKKLTTKIVKE